MKIFDWVHRRMHTNKEYRRVPQQKKDPYVREDGGEDQGEKKAFLMDLNHVTSIDRVLDGILTIGTLGLLDYQCQQELIDVDSNPHPLFLSVHSLSKGEKGGGGGEEEEEEKEEEAAVEFTAALPNHCSLTNIESLKKEKLAHQVDAIKNGNMENTAAGEGDLLEPLLQAIKASRRERITLADLFLVPGDQLGDEADPTSQAAPASAKIAVEKEANGAVQKAPSCRAKCGGSLTKKLAQWKKGGEDSPQATKKLPRMMRRMLKKKIHPEMARDIHVSVPGLQSCGHNSSIDETATLI